MRNSVKLFECRKWLGVLWVIGCNEWTWLIYKYGILLTNCNIAHKDKDTLERLLKPGSCNRECPKEGKTVSKMPEHWGGREAETNQNRSSPLMTPINNLETLKTQVNEFKAIPRLRHPFPDSTIGEEKRLDRKSTVDLEVLYHWTLGQTASDRTLSDKTASGEAAISPLPCDCVVLVATYVSFN